MHVTVGSLGNETLYYMQGRLSSSALQQFRLFIIIATLIALYLIIICRLTYLRRVFSDTFVMSVFYGIAAGTTIPIVVNMILFGPFEEAFSAVILMLICPVLYIPLIELILIGRRLIMKQTYRVSLTTHWINVVTLIISVTVVLPM